MQVPMSNYLQDQKSTLKKLIEILSDRYEYVSVLGTDTYGTQYSVQKTGIDISDSMWTERGFVIRVHNGINYSEFSFNEISEDNLDSLITNITTKLENDINSLKNSSIEISDYPVIQEEPIKKSFFGSVKIMPKDVSAKEKIERLVAIKEKALDLSEYLVDFRVAYEEVHISKLFISNKKELEQSYIWSQGYLVPIVRKENITKFAHKGYSGLKGVELIDELESNVEDVVSYGVKLLDAKKVTPGEYDIICAPDITGLIAHEAFGHGVEMDMFVKNRAKAVEYIDKPVASNLVTMHDGALAAKEVSSYFFDDEGTLGTDTIIIDNGILKTGISDLLSALKLGTKPTGNGKRESFERKAYARMTNTFIAAGNDTLEDMIASIKNGYLLEGLMSGMEDPKNWGIQCMILQGKEIKDGKLTGNIVSPVILTGYVPELLKSISMVSEKVELSGTGYCGKGYKEFVKTSNGGPYIKARGRLG
ncbi:TldD/PmbA family protein [Caldisalinibacter kiritimatiensis]|uniref:TldD protein, part of proposed TldE/TldD proteolytic complex n=1 Tax=Caldisalinibacter kiritimatiensis TaxID=1304284 RepID=R1CR75_9FIRM|nr:TldD/PmbA family protein [Caldisalinibacter kiritimatiensis]EOD01181.1 TldD protein, part of proposed TldE/TldD proteolytic complex [Caldisalinibacter kiritimatiensis]